jgi:hypothetical protein
VVQTGHLVFQSEPPGRTRIDTAVTAENNMDPVNPGPHAVLSIDDDSGLRVGRCKGGSRTTSRAVEENFTEQMAPRRAQNLVNRDTRMVCKRRGDAVRDQCYWPIAINGEVLGQVIVGTIHPTRESEIASHD